MTSSSETADCARCEDTGLDPDRYTEQRDPEGNVHFVAEPCSECRPQEGDPR